MTALDKLAKSIRVEHEACEQHAKSAVEHAIKAGKLLIEAKAEVKHGEWLPWLAENFEFTDRHARRYMQLAANRTRVSDLDSLRAAVEVIAEPKPAPFVEPTPELMDELRVKLGAQRQKPGPSIKPARSSIKASGVTETPVVPRKRPARYSAEQRQRQIEMARGLFETARNLYIEQAKRGLTDEQAAALRGDIVAFANDFAAVTENTDWDADFGDLLKERN